MSNNKLGLKVLIAAAIILFVIPLPSFAKTPVPTAAGQVTANADASTAPDSTDSYYRGKVIKIIKEGVDTSDGQTQPWQELQVELLSGDQKGQRIDINNGQDVVDGSYQRYAAGDQVVVDCSAGLPGQPFVYSIADRYRIPNLIMAALAFLALTVYFGRKRGFTSIIGMAFSVLVVFYYIMPQIAKGGDPFVVAVEGAAAIIIISLYLSHGFNRRTSIALASALLSLGLAIVIDLVFVHFCKLTGSGTEDASTLQFNGALSIPLLSVYLGGVIIGVIGVLDDVTIGQSTAIEEIHAANASLSFNDLLKSGRSIGQEHIASMINTLVLAYVGVSFPLLLLYSLQRTQPIWVIFNSDFIAEEIVRTLVGSSVLVVAIPMTTLLAAFLYSRKDRKKNKLAAF
jgi:uncharacterized membrane protein